MALTLSIPGLPRTIGLSYFVTVQYRSPIYPVGVSPGPAPYLTRSRTRKIVKMPDFDDVNITAPFPFLELPNEVSILIDLYSETIEAK